MRRQHLHVVVAAAPASREKGGAKVLHRPAQRGGIGAGAAAARRRLEAPRQQLHQPASQGGGVHALLGGNDCGRGGGVQHSGCRGLHLWVVWALARPGQREGGRTARHVGRTKALTAGSSWAGRGAGFVLESTIAAGLSCWAASPATFGHHHSRPHPPVSRAAAEPALALSRRRRPAVPRPQLLEVQLLQLRLVRLAVAVAALTAAAPLGCSKRRRCLGIGRLGGGAR